MLVKGKHSCNQPSLLLFAWREGLGEALAVNCVEIGKSWPKWHWENRKEQEAERSEMGVTVEIRLAQPRETGLGGLILPRRKWRPGEGKECVQNHTRGLVKCRLVAAQTSAFSTNWLLFQEGSNGSWAEVGAPGSPSLVHRPLGKVTP